MMNLNIAIIGTRGIPNRYGGFEQAAEYLSEGLAELGHRVTVYNSHRHPCQDAIWKGVHRVHCYDPENILHTAGQFIYDFNCIMDARRRKFDIILFLGYTSSSVWHFLFPTDAVIISNMDGLEWKRSKYSRPVRWFLKKAESLAVKHSDFLVADAPGIRHHIQDTYGLPCTCIAYGAVEEKEESLADPGYGLQSGNYYMLMARMEPENNIDTILGGFSSGHSTKKFIVIGHMGNSFGKRMFKKYRHDHRIIFAGSLFDQLALHRLRKNASLYFHGHSVGGTNPSLLEAMSSRAIIAAHDNVFNRDVLGTDAFYFKSSEDVNRIIEAKADETLHSIMKKNNYEKIGQHYRWPHIIALYDSYFRECYQKSGYGEPVQAKRYAYE